MCAHLSWDGCHGDGGRVYGGVVGIMEHLSQWISNLQVLSPLSVCTPQPQRSLISLKVTHYPHLQLFQCFFSILDSGGGGKKILQKWEVEFSHFRRARWLDRRGDSMDYCIESMVKLISHNSWTCLYVLKSPAEPRDGKLTPTFHTFNDVNLFFFLGFYITDSQSPIFPPQKRFFSPFSV